MGIQAYFTQVKDTLEQYAAVNFVLDTSVNFEMRPGNQGYLYGSITFIDGSQFFFREYLDALARSIDKLMYPYHYQDDDTRLIFRYDNARHRPPLPFQEHKHVFAEDDIVQAQSPAIEDVLAEIARQQGWI